MTQKISSQTIGVGCAFGAASLFGIAPSFSALAYQSGAGSMTMSVVRGLVMLLMFGFLIVRRGRGASLDPASFGYLTLFSLFNLAFIYLYETAIRLGGPSQSLLLLFTHPILVLFIQVLRGREHFQPKHGLMAILCFGGIALAAAPWTESFRPAGFLYGLASSAATAAGVVAYDKLNVRRPGSDYGCLLGMGLGVVLAFSPAAILVEGPAFPATTLGWFGMISSALGAAISFYLFVRGIALAGAVKAILVTNIEPIIGILCAALIAREKLTPHVVIGAVLVVLGLIDWTNMRSMILRRRPQAVEPDLTTV